MKAAYYYKKDVKPDCILSVRAPNSTGYPQINKEGKVTYVHRDVYAAANGLTKDQMKHIVVRHTCDCRQCINPAHLIGGTVADNNMDMRLRGRASGGGMTGTDNPAAKLTLDVVVKIRADSKLAYADRAKKYGISKSQVARTVNNQYWKGCDDEVT